ncbi:kinase-like protein [Aspergillus carlsbadensis]|nr:kinase-like protein [Aspergillus carlsbadensis]
MEYVERLEGYRPGGYHPVAIGDVLNSRYRIVDKLGHGGFSTIWLCRDDQTGRYRAAKLGIAESNPREMEVLDLLASSGSDPEQEMLPKILDRFVVHGPNGAHPCFITTPAMCSISAAKEGSWIQLFQPSTARSLAVQLTRVVAYLHRRGIVHGDLHLGNYLLRLPASFDELSVDELYEKCRPPSLEPVVRFDKQPLGPNVPTHGIAPTWLGQKPEKLSPEVNIILTDFREAFFPSTETRDESHTPLAFGPPEAHSDLGQSLSYPADVWTLGCAMWEILGQRPLFHSFLADEDDIRAAHINTFGNFPPEWFGRWKKKSRYFQESGEPIEFRQVPPWGRRLESDIQKPRREAGIWGFDDEEKDDFVAMLRSMFRFRPEERASVEDILRSDWMVKWALPDYEKSRTKP